MTNELVNIYVIMHDDEEVYVGYTKNIKDRWIQYKSAYMNDQSAIHKELMTQYMTVYGWYNFSIQLVEEDVEKCGVLNRIEYWIDAYKELGCNMINKTKTGITRPKVRENCTRCGIEINSRDRARHQRTMTCKLTHRGFGDVNT